MDYVKDDMKESERWDDGWYWEMEVVYVHIVPSYPYPTKGRKMMKMGNSSFL